MTTFIKNGGIYGIAVVDATTAAEAKEMMITQFPDIFQVDGKVCEWVKDWMPAEVPRNQVFFIDGSAKLFRHLDKKGLVSD